MPIKICFVTNYAYKLFNRKSKIAFGGIETIFYVTAKALNQDKRFSVSFLLEDDIHVIPATEKQNGIVIFKSSRQYNPCIYRDKQVEKYHRWFVYWAGKFDSLWKWPHLDFFRLWEKMKQINADVYIFASPSYESGLLTLITKLIRKKSVFIVVNDEILSNRSLFFILRHSDAVVCYSPRHQKELRRRYWLKTVLIPPWFPRPQETLPLAKRKYLLWVGRVETRKHPEILLAMAKRLPQYSFIMVVASAPEEADLYRKIIFQAGKIKNLTLRKNIALNRLGNYYQRALAFIDTSGYKNLNMTQVQAAVFKTPSLSFFNDPNDSFAEYNWGLNAGASENKMVKNIDRLANDGKYWLALSVNAGKFADKVYGRENNLIALKNLLLKLSK